MDHINTRYQIDDCVEWITKNDYKKIVLQFSEAEMPDSVQVVKSLTNRLPTTGFYTVVTASCSVDYLAPLRLGDSVIQSIICFGSGLSKTNLCLSSSSTAFDQTPVLFVFGSNQELSVDIQFGDRDLLLYDLKCVPFLKTFKERNRIRDDQVGKVRMWNEMWSFTKCAEPYVTSDTNSLLPFGNFGIKEPIGNYDNIFWIGYCDDIFYQVNLAKDKVTLIKPASCQTAPIWEDLKPRVILNRRLALIEKAKLAKNIGLVFNSSIPNVDLVVSRVKTLSKRKGKKLFYLSLVQEADNTKFGNFPLIEVFVIISSCTCGSLAKKIRAHAPLITLTEYEISLGMKKFYGGHEWNIDEVEEEQEIETVSGSSNQIMEYRQRMGTSWYGLQVAAGHDPVGQIEEGSVGLASGYSHEMN